MSRRAAFMPADCQSTPVGKRAEYHSALQSSASGCGVARASEVTEVFEQTEFHVLARHDGIDQSVVEQEFSGLKARGQFSLSSILNDTWPRKTNHGAWFCQNQITNGGKAGH